VLAIFTIDGAGNRPIFRSTKMGSLFSKIVGVFTKAVPSDSTSGTVNSADLAKVIRTGLFLAASTGVTYILTNVQPDMFGQYAGVATITIAMLGELSVRLFRNNTK
jgi:hypothetical protein